MADPIQLDAIQPLRFLLIQTSDHITGAAGVTPTVTIAKNDGLGFLTPTGAVTELGSGWYELAGDASDADTLGPLSLHASASGCDPADREFVVVPSLVALAAALSPPSTSALALTGRTLVTNALGELNVLAENETASGPQLTLGMSILNRMLDSWNTEHLLLPVEVRSTFSLVNGTASYTIGPTGTWSLMRPMQIQHAGVIPVGTVFELPVYLMTRAEYEMLSLKTLQMLWPTRLIFEPGTPDGTITVYPVPTTTATIVLYIITAMAQFADENTAYTFQPGYYEALHYNLALQMARPYGAVVDGLLLAQAKDSKGKIKRMNEVPQVLPVDPAVLGTWNRGVYDINSDQTFR